jgi:hypothetical protein
MAASPHSPSQAFKCFANVGSFPSRKITTARFKVNAHAFGFIGHTQSGYVQFLLNVLPYKLRALLMLWASAMRLLSGESPAAYPLGFAAPEQPP